MMSPLNQLLSLKQEKQIHQKKKYRSSFIGVHQQECSLMHSLHGLINFFLIFIGFMKHSNSSNNSNNNSSNSSNSSSNNSSSNNNNNNSNSHKNDVFVLTTQRLRTKKEEERIASLLHCRANARKSSSPVWSSKRPS